MIYFKIHTSLLHFLFMFFIMFSHHLRNGRTVFHPVLMWDRVIQTLSGLDQHSSVHSSWRWTPVLGELLPHLCLAWEFLPGCPSSCIPQAAGLPWEGSAGGCSAGQEEMAHYSCQHRNSSQERDWAELALVLHHSSPA